MTDKYLEELQGRFAKASSREEFLQIANDAQRVVLGLRRALYKPAYEIDTRRLELSAKFRGLQTKAETFAHRPVKPTPLGLKPKEVRPAKTRQAAVVVPTKFTVSLLTLKAAKVLREHFSDEDVAAILKVSVNAVRNLE